METQKERKTLITQHRGIQGKDAFQKQEVVVMLKDDEMSSKNKH